MAMPPAEKAIAAIRRTINEARPIISDYQFVPKLPLADEADSIKIASAKVYHFGQ